MIRKKKHPIPIADDITEYGEFISSFDKWITPDEQHKKAEELEEDLGE